MIPDGNEQGTVRYIRCASCGAMNPASAPACVRCGKPQHVGAQHASAEPPAPPLRTPVPTAIPQVLCPKCHKSFPAGSKFCGYCGTPLPVAPPLGATPPAPVPPSAVSGPQSAAPPLPLPRPVGPPPPLPTPPAARPAPSQPPLASSAVLPTGGVSAPPTAAPPLPLPRPVAPPPPLPTPSGPSRMNVPESAVDGTVVFSGLRAVPRLEARISEKKPDGSWGKTVPITKETIIGRENCDLNYPHDTLLSPRHASVAIREGKLMLKDLKQPKRFLYPPKAGWGTCCGRRFPAGARALSLCHPKP